MADTEDLGKKLLSELLIGYEVVIEFMAGLDINEENRDAVIQDKEILRGAPEARMGTFWLTSLSMMEIEVAREPEDAPVFFLPWGNVLRMYSGLSREKIEESYREAMASSDAAAEDNPTLSHRRCCVCDGLPLFTELPRRRVFSETGRPMMGFSETQKP